ncbi:MAG: hypothetical protein Rubg2KO_02190 [Rubricoccaceae bacterium]
MASAKRTLLLALTLMLSGRAMTLAFISRAGGGAVGDPPAAWLMPLVGDAVIGVTALFIAYLIWRRVGLFAWTAILVWNVVAIWDAFSAFLIHQSVPWPTFFMTEIFGSSMFFVAAAMHGLCLVLVASSDGRAHFLGPASRNATPSLA